MPEKQPQPSTEFIQESPELAIPPAPVEPKSAIQLMYEDPTYQDALAENLFGKVIAENPKIVGAQLMQPVIIERANVDPVEVAQAPTAIPENTTARIPDVAHTLRARVKSQEIKATPVDEHLNSRTAQEEVFYSSLLGQARESTSSRRAQIEFLLDEPMLIADLSYDLEQLLTPEQFKTFKEHMNVGMKTMFPKELRRAAGIRSVTQVLAPAPEVGTADEISLREKREKLITTIDQVGHVTSSAFSPYTEKYAVDDPRVDETITRRFGAGVAEMGYALVEAAENARTNIALVPDDKMQQDRIDSLDNLTVRGRRLMLRGEVMMTLASDITDAKKTKIERSFHRETTVSDEVAEKDHNEARIGFARSFELALATPDVQREFFIAAKFPELLHHKTGMLANADARFGFEPEKVFSRATQLAKDAIYERVSEKVQLEKRMAGKIPAKVTDDEVKARVALYMKPDSIGNISKSTDTIMALNRALKLGSLLPTGAVDRVCSMMIAGEYLNRLPPQIVPEGRYAELEATATLRSVADEIVGVSKDDVLNGIIPPHLFTRFNKAVPRAMSRALVEEIEQNGHLVKTGKAPKRILGNTFDPALTL